jgi:hypothetical protein
MMYLNRYLKESEGNSQRKYKEDWLEIDNTPQVADYSPFLLLQHPVRTIWSPEPAESSDWNRL